LTERARPDGRIDLMSTMMRIELPRTRSGLPLRDPFLTSSTSQSGATDGACRAGAFREAEGPALRQKMNRGMSCADGGCIHIRSGSAHSCGERVESIDIDLWW
jgi:hypothetical protein